MTGSQRYRFSILIIPLMTMFILVLIPVIDIAAETEQVESSLKADSANIEQRSDSVSAGTVESKSQQNQEKEASEEEKKVPGVADFLFSGKYLAFATLLLAGVILLLGKWINIWVRIFIMLIAFILFGLDFFFPLHPSPMCAVTKLFMFKITHGQFFAVFIALFLAVFIPSLIGRKLFCGWVCPLGALQDLVNKIPHKYHLKKFNFTTFNSVRMTLLAMFLLTFFFVKDHIAFLAGRIEADITLPIWKAFSAYSVYTPINFFELLHWSVDLTFIIMMSILVIASLILYRPFCYLICPVGALTWLFEKIAPGRIKVDLAKCNDCGDCEEKSPCPTIAVLKDENARAVPDCNSCGECIGICPDDAISFRFKY